MQRIGHVKYRGRSTRFTFNERRRNYIIKILTDRTIINISRKSIVRKIIPFSFCFDIYLRTICKKKKKKTVYTI